MFYKESPDHFDTNSTLYIQWIGNLSPCTYDYSTPSVGSICSWNVTIWCSERWVSCLAFWAPDCYIMRAHWTNSGCWTLLCRWKYWIKYFKFNKSIKHQKCTNFIQSLLKYLLKRRLIIIITQLNMNITWAKHIVCVCCFSWLIDIIQKNSYTSSYGVT